MLGRMGDVLKLGENVSAVEVQRKKPGIQTGQEFRRGNQEWFWEEEAFELALKMSPV